MNVSSGRASTRNILEILLGNQERDEAQVEAGSCKPATISSVTSTVTPISASATVSAAYPVGRSGVVTPVAKWKGCVSLVRSLKLQFDLAREFNQGFGMFCQA